MAKISPAEARALLAQGWTYLDVRSRPEFAAGRPAGAVNVPLMDAGPGGLVANPNFLADVEGRFAKDAKLVVGCQAGGRSQRAAAALLQAGFLHVEDQRAGFGGSRGSSGEVEPGWEAAGLPVERG